MRKRRPRLPDATIVAYRRLLFRELDRVQARILRLLEPRLPEREDARTPRWQSVGVAVDTAELGGLFDKVAKTTATETKKLIGFASKVGDDSRDAFIEANTDLITSLDDYQIDELEGILANGFAKGWDVDTFRKEIQGRFDVVRSRAELIARDQVLKLNANLTRERHENAGISEYTWSTSNDERVRQEHADLDGQRFTYDDPPETNEDGDTNNPGEDYQCVPGDARISLHSPAVKAYRRWYCGELTELVTHTGEVLRVTANHPCLTRRGWIAAHLVKVGDYLVKVPGESLDGAVRDPQGGEAEACELFRALALGGNTHRVARGVVGFHGDVVDQDVDVVHVDRDLDSEAPTQTTKVLREDALVHADAPGFRQGDLASMLPRLRDAANGDVGRFGEAHALLGRGVGHALVHGGASPATLDATIAKHTRDREARVFSDQTLGDRELALAAEVGSNDLVFVEVESVRGVAFDGWVYNFETLHGWYTSNTLAVHNCRCVAIPVIPDDVPASDDSDDPESDDDAA